MVFTIHRAAAWLATLTIATFWTSTVISEAFLCHAAVAMVKAMIPHGFLVLVPALAAAGGTGLRLARGRKAGFRARSAGGCP